MILINNKKISKEKAKAKIFKVVGISINQIS